MTKDELVEIMSNSVEETNRRHAISKKMPMDEYEVLAKWNRPNLDYTNEMLVEDLVRKNIISVE
jgi:hypothetical protein